MYKGPWELKCIESFKLNSVTFEQGTIYRVKDKFPDDNDNLDKGIWEVVNSGSLFNIDYLTRSKHFIPA